MGILLLLTVLMYYFPLICVLILNHLSRKELFPYMNLSNLKTLVKVRGVFPIVRTPTSPPGGYFFGPWYL